MDLQCDQVELHSRRRLKIRRAPSCKISAAPSSSSFHGSCSQIKLKKPCNNIVIQPLIFHTVDPEIIKTEPAEFMQVVQRLTGSPDTRRFVRMWMRRSKEMQSSLQVQDVELMQQGMQESNDEPLKEGRTCLINPIIGINHSPSSSNPSDLSKNMNQSPELHLSSQANHPPELHLLSHANQEIKTNLDLRSPLISPASSDLTSNYPLASDLSSDTNQINHKTKNPSSCVASNSAENTNSAIFSGVCGASAKASDELYNTRGAPCSPVSPNSSLTTSSEDYHTEDHLSTEAGGASPSPYREALCFEPVEDGSINFFDFSLDSYYGSYHGAQDEVEFHLSNVLVSFY